MDSEVVADTIVEFDARPPVVHRAAITRLRIDQELLTSIGCRVDSGSTLVALRDWCVQFITQTIVQTKFRGDFPGVLNVKLKRTAADSRRTDILPIGEVRR